MSAPPSDGLLGRIERGRSGRVQVWSLGGAGFAIRWRDDLVYIDPYLSTPDPGRPLHRAFPPPFSPDDISVATAVLSTHEHNDHCDPSTLRAFASRTGALFVGPPSSSRKAEAAGYPASRVKELTAGEGAVLSDSLSVTAHRSKDPYEPEAVTLMVRTPRGNIFHTGDSSYFDGFGDLGRGWKVDVALINFGKQIPDPAKPYYMDAESAAKTARDLRADVAVPMHWTLWKEAWDDPRKVESALGLLSPGTKFVDLGVGGVLEL